MGSWKMLTDVNGAVLFFLGAGVLLFMSAVPSVAQETAEEIYLRRRAQQIIEEKKQSSDPRERAFAYEWEKNQRDSEERWQRTQNKWDADRRSSEANRTRMMIFFGVIIGAGVIASAVAANNQSKCAKCGAKLQKGAQYCPSCGVEINVEL